MFAYMKTRLASMSFNVSYTLESVDVAAYVFVAYVLW